MSTIQEHYNHLRVKDPASWNAMNGALAGMWYQKGDCLSHLKRSLLPRENNPDRPINLAVIPGFIQKQFVDFLGFTWEDIWSNRIPELTISEPAI